MVFGLGLGAGLKALTAAQLGIQTAGQNVANVNTPGYTRQRVLQSASLPVPIGTGMQIGTGVHITDISRIVDAGLEARMRLQRGLFGSTRVDHQRLVELEGAFGEPDNGLGALFTEFFGAISALQTDPADRSLLGGLVQSGRSLADGFGLLADRINGLQDSTFDEVRGLVRQVNEHADAIAALNVQIISLEVNDAKANDLRDTRETHIKEIAALVDTQVLERGTGATDLLVGGHLLVSGDRATELSATVDSAGLTGVVAGSGGTLNLRSGRIHGLLRQQATQMPGVLSQLDLAARNLILELNRLHTTGVPHRGSFDTLISFYGSADGDGDGIRGDELLAQAGLPYDVRGGELWMTVTGDGTSDIQRTRISIDPWAMSLADLADAIGAVDHVGASVDASGRLRITSESGYGFHFGPGLDPSPDASGFGGAAPSLGTPTTGPFDLSSSGFPLSFDVITGTASAPVTTTVTLDAAEFVNTSAVTVDELVDAINADLGAEGTAENVGGRLLIRSSSTGAASQLQLVDISGNPVTTLGLPTSIATGQDAGVEVQVSGVYTGSSNGQLTFAPDADGEIGVTSGLTIGVFDHTGARVATLDVGRDYSPGSAIEVADGVSVSFGPGGISQSAGHVFALDTLADPDTADVLVALGLNSFFHGSRAADIRVNPALTANPDLVAAGLSDATGDGDNLARMMALRETELDALDASSIEGFYAGLVSDIGLETASAALTLQSEEALMAHLEQQREAVSGVNVDEEMVDMVRFQHAFEAAARFIDTVNELASTLINLGRSS